MAKTRGRPATTGAGTFIGVRLQDDDLSEVDAWRRRTDDLPTRPEAIRRLMRRGLEASKKGRR
jgi:hypothetical protein